MCKDSSFVFCQISVPFVVKKLDGAPTELSLDLTSTLILVGYHPATDQGENQSGFSRQTADANVLQLNPEEMEGKRHPFIW